ncbi:ferredoxin:glutaredoxin reductase [bacterium]|nr:ferredoxin:glutaredoxin reductase [bacterium]
MKEVVQKRGGNFLNPDDSMTNQLLESLLINEERYGYLFCPCRLATGKYTQDLSMICPCDYRDEDINEFGTCYCGLYVSREVLVKKKEVITVPERKDRPPSPIKMWRCKVCGYLCVRPLPPDVCPICGVTHDRFEEYRIK